MSFDYLTDEELDNLIRECESDLVQAPSGLLDKVLNKVEGSHASIPNITDIRTANSRERKIKEYNRFKWQVIGSLVASFALFLTLHALMPVISSYIGDPKMPSKAEVLASCEIPTKEEVLSKQQVPSKLDVISNKKDILLKADILQKINNNKLFKEDEK